MKIPVYVISLVRDDERREKIRRDFSRLGIEFKFFDAIDAKDSRNTALIESMRTNGAGPEMTDGEIACTLSHQFVYQDMLATATEWAVILEDDVIVDYRFQQFVATFDEREQRKLNKDNLYLLGGQKGLYDYPVLGMSLFSTVKVAGLTFHRVNFNQKKIRRTCCYLMNNMMAHQLIDMTNYYGTYLADDWDFIYKQNIIRYFYLDEIILHPVVNELNSHLEKERVLNMKQKTPRTPLNKKMKYIRSWIKVTFFSLLK